MIQMIYFLLLLGLLTLGSSMNLFVNASITEASGSSYPTLQAAVAALYSGNTLIDTTNTITLLSNTAGTTQTITRSLTGNSGTGSIGIQFESPPSSLDSLSKCDQLPRLSLKGTSILSAKSLTSLTISGLYIIQRYTIGMSHELNNIATVTLSNFCLDLTEELTTATPTTNYKLYISYASEVKVTNAYIIYDATKALWAQYSNKVMVSSIAVEVTSAARDTTNAAIQVYQAGSIYNTEFIATDIQIICSSDSIPAQTVLYSDYIITATYLNIHATNCNFSTSTVTSGSGLIYSAVTQNVVIDNVTFTGFTFGDVQVKGLISISGNRNTSISNIQINSITTSNSQTQGQLIYIHHFAGVYYSPGIYLIANNISINNATIRYDLYTFHVFLGSRAFIAGIELTNFTANNWTSQENSYLITVDIAPSILDTPTTAIKTFYFNNINVLNSYFKSDHVMHFNYAFLSNLPCVEVFHVQFNNVYLENNFINDTYFFKIEGYLARFVSITAKNLTLLGTSALIKTANFVGSLFVISSTFTDCVVNRSSGLIFYDGSQQLKIYSPYLTKRYNRIEGGWRKNETSMYMETRPFIVANSTFENIYAVDASIVVWSTNPQSIFQGNTLRNITLRDSRFLQLGDYVIFATIYSYFHTADDEYIYVPTVTWFDFFPAAEEAALSGNSQIRALFYDARNQTCSYDSKNCAVFIYVKDNTVDQTTTETSENMFVMGFENFQVPNSSVIVINNTFSKIQGETTVNFPIVFSDSIRRAFFIGNQFTQVNMPGYAISFTSTLLDTFFSDSNIITNSSKLSGYQLECFECNNITFQNMITTNIEPESNFISMSCTFIVTQIVLTNSVFGNVVQKSNQGALQATNFIFISTQKTSSSYLGSIQFQDNIFKNITLTREDGHTANTIGTSLILLFMTQSYAILQNITLNNIFLPEGTILTVSTPNLTIANSSFHELSFGDSKGAFNLIVQDLILFNSMFTDSKSNNYNGAGLITLTTPNPSVSEQSVNVDISNCTFTNNSAAYGTILYASTLKIQLLMKDSFLTNNLVSGNQGQLVFQDVSGSIDITSSTHTSNFLALQLVSNYFISIQSSSQAYLTVKDCSYQVAGNNYGGFLYAHQNPALYTLFNNFTFSQALNPATGVPSTAILVADDINAYFTGITVTGLTLDESPIFVINCDMLFDLPEHSWNLTIDQSTFDSLNLTLGVVSIRSDEYQARVLDKLNISITNSSFSNINFIGAGSVITSATSLIGNDKANYFSVVMRYCTFSQIHAVEASTIFSSVESRYQNILWLDNNTFHKISSSSILGGGIANPSTVLLSEEIEITIGNDSTLKLTNNTFIDINSYKGGIISWRSLHNPTTIILDNNTFESVTTTQDGGIIYANYSPTATSTITRSTVINVTNNVFSTIEAENGGIIHFDWTLSSFYKINFASNPTCEAITVRQNGGIINLPKSSTFNYSSLSASNLRLLSGNNQTSDIIIIDNNMKDISATNGAVIFEYTPNKTLNLSFIDNILDELHAAERGGVAYANQPNLLMQGNIGSDITTGVSGPILFSVVGELNLVDSANNINGVSQITSMFAFAPTNIAVTFKRISDSAILPLKNYDTLSSTPIAMDLTSRSLSLYQLNLTLVYAGVHGILPIIDNSADAVMQLIFKSTNPLYPPQDYPPFTCQNATCLVTPSSITLPGMAGDIYIVNATYRSSSFNQFQQFMIRLRGCVPGELNQSATGECIECPQKTYSLSPSDKQCLDCPVGADCRGGNDIWIKEGYYRSAVTSDLSIMPCNNSERCLGGKENNCSKEYTGPFCLQCNQANGYIPDSGNNCFDCNNEGNLAWEILLIIGGLSYQLFLVINAHSANTNRFRETLRNTSTPKNTPRHPIRPAEVIVVFTTFMQICSVIVVIDTSTVIQFLNISYGVGNPGKQVVWSLKCLYYKKEMDPLTALKLELLFYIFSPLAKLLLALLVELIRMLIKGFKERKTSITRLGSVAVYLILLEQPNIIGALTNYLTCSKLDPHIEDQFMKNPTLVQCYTPEYFSFRNKAVFPALAVWGICIPLVIFLILFKNRKRLQESEVLNVIFGSLYTSYHEGAYYWGVVIILCKMILFTLNSVLGVHEITKYVTFLVILQLYYEGLKRKTPYIGARRFLLKCETYCVIAYRVALLLLIVKSSERGSISIVFDLLILITVIIPGVYLVFWVINMRVKAYKAKIQALRACLKRRLRKKKKELEETPKGTVLSMQSQTDEMQNPTNRNILSTNQIILSTNK